MKNTIKMIAIVFVAKTTFAQNPNGNSNANTQWKINGNIASTSDFMGTTKQTATIKAKGLSKTLNLQKK